MTKRLRLLFSKDFGKKVMSWTDVDDGREGFSYALTYTYDAAIIDIMLPGMDGLGIIDELRNRGLTLPVIILSARRSVEDRLRGFQRGTDDYLTKPFALSELLARVAALIRRASNMAEPGSLSYHDLNMDLLGRSVTRVGIRLQLQPRVSLLEYLMRKLLLNYPCVNHGPLLAFKEEQPLLSLAADGVPYADLTAAVGAVCHPACPVTRPGYPRRRRQPAAPPGRQ